MSRSEENTEDVAYGLKVIQQLSEAIGPRPPGSPAEREAASFVSAELAELGFHPAIEEFRSGRSFGPGYLLAFGLALGGSMLQQRRGTRAVGHVLAAAGAATLLAEARFLTGPTDLLRWKRSRNVIGTMEPRGAVARTVCVASHLDSSRSGLIFHPNLVGRLGPLAAATGVATLLQVISWPLTRSGPLRLAGGLARLLVGAGIVLVAERELRGVDVAGANDNASGVGACLALARSLRDIPLERTRVVILTTGSEESGVLGMRDFLARHKTEDWLFVNFDGVGTDAPLRVLAKEGGPLSSHTADPELLALADAVGREDPELVAPPLDHGSGLPYDATPVLAKGGRALSVVNQGEGAIPDYHWPTDRMDRISSRAFGRAVRFGRALLDRVDRG